MSTELSNLLGSFHEALTYWAASITTKEAVSKIKSAQVQNPQAELTKLAELIKAHTTKVGIIFNPEVLKKLPQGAYTTLQKLSETTVLLVSVVAQLSPKELSDILYNEILLCVQQVLASTILLVDQLILLDSENDGKVAVESDGRLVSVGKVWASCDSLCKVVEEGKLGVLNRKFKLSILLIEDGLDEFEEWAEDPEQVDDPFGFSDSEEEEPVAEMDEEVKQQLIQFSQAWAKRFKLIKLLLISVSKSLPSVTSAEHINTIYQAQKDVVASVDKMIVDLMINCRVSKEIEQYGIDITKNCNVILKIVKDINKSNETKVKWCETWSEKFH